MKSRGDTSVHVFQFPSFGCPGDIHGEHVQSQDPDEDVYPGGAKHEEDAVTMATQHSVPRTKFENGL